MTLSRFRDLADMGNGHNFLFTSLYVNVQFLSCPGPTAYRQVCAVRIRNPVSASDGSFIISEIQ
jgi:hypothetical protein